MERSERPRTQPHASRRPMPPLPAGVVVPDADEEPPVVGAAACVRLDAPALLVEASFRGVVLAARLVGRDAVPGFLIGGAHTAHAPVSPAFIAGPEHAIIEADRAGFSLNLSPVMRAMLWTEMSSVELRPDMGRVEAPLTLRATDVVRVECGDMIFDIAP